MKKRTGLYSALAAMFALAFLVLIFLIKLCDVVAIGPLGSEIGLSSVNGAIRDAIGYSELWYDLSEWTIFAALGTAALFCALGLWQLIRRKSLKRVDADIYLLGGFYLAVVAVYLLFEVLSLNFRPVLVDGELEASFPSSHVMIVGCMLFVCAHQLYHRLRSAILRISSVAACVALLVFALVGRLLSGMHWFTDILGGALVGAALVCCYLAIYSAIKRSK
ncbi:MAG: phosphatase PAP2 family protein [Ruminococcaceae bacterium]|nr:phosphatase PAP2 family protein [Oscillospiraceae bacterium]